MDKLLRINQYRRLLRKWLQNTSYNLWTYCITLNYCTTSILQYCAHLNIESVSHIAKYGGLWITLPNFSARVGELAVALPSLCDFLTFWNISVKGQYPTLEQWGTETSYWKRWSISLYHWSLGSTSRQNFNFPMTLSQFPFISTIPMVPKVTTLGIGPIQLKCYVGFLNYFTPFE